MAPLLAEQRRGELDELLVVAAGESVSRLAWLYRGSTSASPMAIRGELDKLRFLRGLDAHRIDLSCLPDARRRRLAGVGRRATNQALARRDADKRFPVLLATVAECAVEVLDELVQMFDQASSWPPPRRSPTRRSGACCGTGSGWSSCDRHGNHHHRLPLASVWGGGTMSSSDGQRFPMRGKSLTARALSRYFVDEGVSTYTHVSDQHTTYGTKVIPVTDREAVYVLDEILGNATDLPITEHATDTAG